MSISLPATTGSPDAELSISTGIPSAARSTGHGRQPLAPLLCEGVTAEQFGDRLTDGGALFPAEASAVAGASAQRRREFRIGRQIARTALVRLGRSPVAVPADPLGAPQWPAGVLGSITHCRTESGVRYTAAVVAASRLIRGIGIDAEPDSPLEPAVLDLIAGPGERVMIDRLAVRQPRMQWERILFCVKEAVYKAWYPITRRWLDFSDCDVTLALDGTFTARLPAWGPLVPGVDLAGCSGRWTADHGLILAGCTIGGAPR